MADDSKRTLRPDKQTNRKSKEMTADRNKKSTQKNMGNRKKWVINHEEQKGTRDKP